MKEKKEEKAKHKEDNESVIDEGENPEEGNDVTETPAVEDGGSDETGGDTADDGSNQTETPAETDDGTAETP